jgi:F0F1-type ATP synthase membrane subunit b/b'
VHEFRIFLFGVLNFAALVGVLWWKGRRVVKNYFYARRLVIRKQMIQAAHQRRDAKIHASKSRRLAANLKEELGRRKNASVELCKDECSAILDLSRQRSERIIEAAKKQAERERAQALVNVRDHLLRDAFVNARKLIAIKMTGDMKKLAVEHGLADLGTFLSSRKNREEFGGEPR